MARRSATVLLLAAAITVPALLQANPGYGGREKKACIHCHVNVGGGGGLSGNGSTYLKEGRKFPDPKDQATPTPTPTPTSTEPTPTTSGPPPGGGGGSGGGVTPDVPDTPETAEQRQERERLMAEIEANLAREAKHKANVRYKRVVAAGKKFFTEPSGVSGTTGKSCKDCHQPGKLAASAANYPRWHKGLQDVVTFDRMMRFCIYHRMKGTPLTPESDTTVALATYLREVSAGHVK